MIPAPPPRTSSNVTPSVLSDAIRPAVDDDIPAIVDLVNIVNPPEERVTLKEYRYWETLRDPKESFNRLVVPSGALNQSLRSDSGQVAAVTDVGNNLSRPLHMFRLWIAVHPEVRRRGIGTELEQRQRAFAAAHGGTELTAVIPDSDAVSRTFLERHGYQEAYQRFEMELNVETFDWTRYPDWRRQLGDLRLLTVADLGTSEADMQRMYEYTMLLNRDVPHPEGPPQFSYELFKKYFAMPGFRADGLFILADGDEWVGMTGLLVLEGRPAYTYFTGVRRDYRGRGLATLLKLASIAFARDHGVTAMRTNNDTVNYPMVAVNEKLGYRRLPARVAMKLSW